MTELAPQNPSETPEAPSGSTLRHDGEDAVRALIVDDEDVLRSTLARVLRQRGIVAETAENGFTALDMLEKSSFDVVLVDVRMPGMTGPQFLQRVKAANYPVEVLMMTAFADIATTVSAVKAGAHGFLTKPFVSNESVVLEVLNAAQFPPPPREDREPPARAAHAAARRRDGRQLRVDARGLPAHRRRRDHELHDPHPRRERHRQGARRARGARALAAREQADGDHQLRGHPQGARRERAVRAHARRLHHRGARARRSVRGGERRNALPRRDRRPAHERAGEAAARAAVRRGEARRQRHVEDRRRARGGGHERRPQGGHRRGHVPPGSLLPPQRHRGAPARAARAGGRPPAARASLHPEARAARRSPGHAPQQRGRAAHPELRPGRATCASSSTPSSTPSCSRRAT